MLILSITCNFNWKIPILFYFPLKDNLALSIKSNNYKMPRLCNFENCKKRANYGPNRTTNIRCREHRDGMKLCIRLCNCGKARPSYNEPGKNKLICCVRCKTDTMIDVNSKRCRCGKARPYFNEPGESNAICCVRCKTDTMIDVKSKRCRCGNTRPHFNEPGESTAICCMWCKTDTMVNVITPTCPCGSKYQTIYNEPGKNKPICCALCKTDTMVNARQTTCKGWIDKTKTPSSGPCVDNARANKKYKNYCTRCFAFNFPLDPLTFQIRSKTKEIAVEKFINANFEDFHHDRTMSTGNCDCTVRRRIDHRKLIGNTLLAIETDENQHKSYKEMDEQTRYNDLYMAFSGKWIYIRFNPDKFRNKKGKNVNPTIAKRLVRLKEEILKQIERIEKEENTELVERIYLYYDGFY
jgi:hypothetical protein